MYKLKEGVELPKEFKIKVNKKQSEALQNHLFSIGKEWSLNGKQLKQYVEKNHYLFCHIHKNIGYGIDKKRFNEYNYPRIKFKDYFEKVAELTYTESSKKEERINNSKITSFPEKWCIEVTQDNYKELDVYLHRNWKDYEGYKDVWSVIKQGLGMYFHSTSVGLFPRHSLYLRCDGYELITTEQFRKQFGKLVVHEVEFVREGLVSTKAIEKKMLDHLTKCNQMTPDPKIIIEMKDKEIMERKTENAKLQNRLDYYKKKSDRLRKEMFEMSIVLDGVNDEIETKSSICIKQAKEIIELKNIIDENNKTAQELRDIIKQLKKDADFDSDRIKRLNKILEGKQKDLNVYKSTLKKAISVLEEINLPF